MFGPLFSWELSRISRRRIFFLFRTLCGLGLLVVVTITYILSYLSAQMTPNSTAIDFYRDFVQQTTSVLLTGLPFVTLFLAPVYSASAIAEERERRTLDALIVTGLSPYEIVVGKWAARTVTVGSMMLLCAPVILVAQLGGGMIDGARIFYLLFGLTLLAATMALGVLFSSYCKTMNAAFGLCVLATWGLTAASGIIAFWYLAVVAFFDWIGWQGVAESPWLTYIEHVIGFVDCASVQSICARISQSPFPISMARLYTEAQHLAIGIFIHCTITVLCLWLAIRLLRSSNGEAGQGWAAYFKQRQLRHKQSLELPHVWDQPILWKEFHFLTGQRAGRLTIGQLLGSMTFGVVIAVGINYYPAVIDWLHGRPPRHWNNNFNRDLRFAQVIFLGIIGIITTSMSAASIWLERKRSTWDSLLSTCLSNEEILAGKSSAAIRMTIAFGAMMVGMWLTAIAVGELSIFALPFLVIGVGVYTAFFAVFGMRRSLVSTTEVRAQVTSTMVAIVALYIGLGLVMAAILHAPTKITNYLSLAWTPIAAFRWSDLSFIGAFCLMGGVGGCLIVLALTMLIFRRTARHLLKHELRVRNKLEMQGN